jgi:hypothetical protein
LFYVLSMRLGMGVKTIMSMVVAMRMRVVIMTGDDLMPRRQQTGTNHPESSP